MDKNEDDALRLIDLKPLIVFSYQHCDRDIPATLVHTYQFLPLSTAYQRTRQTLKLSTYPFPPLLHNFCRYYSKTHPHHLVNSKRYLFNRIFTMQFEPHKIEHSGKIEVYSLGTNCNINQHCSWEHFTENRSLDVMRLHRRLEVLVRRTKKTLISYALVSCLANYTTGLRYHL